MSTEETDVIYQPHQLRVVAEEIELSDRIDKLENFTWSEAFRQVPKAERHRLIGQRACMVAYRNILRERIAAWTLEPQGGAA